MLMEIEKLNKSQIVLLTLLVSFVTSLATGIVTVSLMEQGVSPVTNTVNQIVERTKEIIVKVPEPQDPIVITETKEVIIHQSDLVAAAVSKNKNSSIIVYKVVPTIVEEVAVDIDADADADVDVDADEEVNVDMAVVTDITTDTVTEDQGTIPQEDQTAAAVLAVESTTPTDRLVFVSRATVLQGDTIIMDASSVTESDVYVVLNGAGERVPAVIQSNNNGVAILTTSIGTPTVLGDTSSLTRGQSVIVLSGIDRLRITTGIISDMVINDTGLEVLEIDKAINTPGSMLINMDGEVIGISTGASRVNGATWFTPTNILEKALHSSDTTDI